MAITLDFILIVFWKVFAIQISLDRSTLPHNQSDQLDQLGSITINIFNQKFNTSTPQFHIHTLDPGTGIVVLIQFNSDNL